MGGRLRGRANNILAACAPTVLNDLLTRAGAAPIATERDVEGAQLKLNLLLTRLPRLRDGATDPRAAFAGTFHVNEGYDSSMRRMPLCSPGASPTSRRARSTATP